MESIIIFLDFFALIQMQDQNHKIKVAPFNFVVWGTVDLQIFASKKLVVDEKRMTFCSMTMSK